MEQSQIKDFRFWFDKEDPENIREMIAIRQPFFFRFRENDYFIEGFIDDGYRIRKPEYFYIDDIVGMGYDTENLQTAYPGDLQARTPEEMMALPFLDGKTIFERFDELRFFEI